MLAKISEQTLIFQVGLDVSSCIFYDKSEKQLYINKNRAASEAIVKRAEKAGFKAIILTVDAAVPGKRELDQRTKLGDIVVRVVISHHSSIS
jgi:isopentenyl diphosphate isomerase/L-lactate dehydrogenase-like FMN-dependent dehydrogenase